MKGYVKPEKLVKGICFVCGNPCDPDRYCHYNCSQAMAEAKERLIQEAKEKAI